MFPPDWEMSERVAVEFCDVTRKQLERIMFRSEFHKIDRVALVVKYLGWVDFDLRCFTNMLGQ